MDSSSSAARCTKARLRLEAKTLQNKLKAIDEEKKKSLLKLNCEILSVKQDFGMFRQISPRISPSRTSLEILNTGGALLVERPSHDRRAASFSGVKTFHKSGCRKDTVLPEIKRRGSSVNPVLINEEMAKSQRSFSLPNNVGPGRSKPLNGLAPNLQLTSFPHNSGILKREDLLHWNQFLR